MRGNDVRVLYPTIPWNLMKNLPAHKIVANRAWQSAFGYFILRNTTKHLFSRTFVRDNKMIRTFGFVFLALSYNGDSVNGFNKSISVYFSLGFSRRASIEWKFANICVIFLDRQ